MSKDEFDKSSAGKGSALPSKASRPPMYKIVFLDNRHVPLPYLTGLFRHHLHKSLEEAVTLALNLHVQEETSVGGVYTNETAESKMMDIQRQGLQDNIQIYWAFKQV